MEYALKQEFHLETSRGAKVSVRTPASPPFGVDALRNQLKIKPGSYLVARIDNKLGSGEARLESVTFYDAVGNAYKFTPVAPNHIAEWGPFMTDEGPMFIDGINIDQKKYRSLNTWAEDLQTTLSAGVEQGTQGNTWLRSESTNLPDEVTRVMVDAHGTPSLIHAYPKSVQGYTKGQ